MFVNTELCLYYLKSMFNTNVEYFEFGGQQGVSVWVSVVIIVFSAYCVILLNDW